MSFHVYRSSAGSGKTFTLVREYLKIVLAEPGSFRNVLAVTFTNKAAGEMKNRVLDCLEELAGPEAGKGKATRVLLPLLEEDTMLTAREISQRASEALKMILHHYSDFAIGTIDSFSHRVIRSFAHDFGLPVNFRVELDGDELIETAVDLLIEKAGDDAPLTTLLAGFLESNMEDDKSWAIERTLADFARLLMDEESQEYLPLLRNLGPEDFSKIAGQLFSLMRSFESQVRQAAEPAVQAIKAGGLSVADFAGGKYGIAYYFFQLSQGKTEKLKISDRNATYAERGNWAGGKASSAVREKIEGISGILSESYLKLKELSGERYMKYRLFSSLSKSVYPLALLNSIDRIMQDFKKQNNIIHISEFNSRIAKIVMGEPVPFIYERTGEKYRHIMIDEFQDTSALQWQNFVPLIENSLASGHFNLVVGDGKQAIYRFRNGDVEQFSSLPALKGSLTNPMIRERENALRRNFVPEDLDVNFRSGSQIVKFNNDLFAFASKFLDEKRKKVYEGLKQAAGAKGPEGYVRISFTAEEMQDARGRMQDERDQEKGSAMIGKTYEIITQCLADGFSHADMAVLCRSNTEASGIARFLVSQGVPVVSGESLLLKYSPSVRLLVALSRQIHGNESPLIQTEILQLYHSIQKPETSPTDPKTYDGAQQPGPMTAAQQPGPMTAAQQPGQREAPNLLHPDPSVRKQTFESFLSAHLGPAGTDPLKELPVFDLYSRLVHAFCPDQTSDAYVQFFLNAVHQFGARKSASAVDFLEWWDEHADKLSVSMPSETDAVQIMTIHKAKGLQFPVVIYPFAGDSLKPTRNFLWGLLDHQELQSLPVALLKSGKDLAETEFAGLYEEERQKSLLDLLNILYVVLTRPESRLYLLPPLPSKDPESISSVPEILKAWLVNESLWEENKSDYEFGSLGMPEIKRKENGTLKQMPSNLYSDWRERIRIRSSAPAAWNLEDPDRNRRFGNLFHTLLAGIGKGAETSEMIGSMLEKGLLDKKREEEVRNKIEKILKDPEYAFIFDVTADVRVEAEILTPEGQAFRPDRVIVSGNKATVVDYKTGKPLKKYADQLRMYAGHLQDMGYTEVKMYLLYLEPVVKLEEVER